MRRSSPTGQDAETSRASFFIPRSTGNPARFRGKSVLVVGPGCSGMEIAHDLATGGAAKVWLSVRTPPNIMLRASPGPVPGDMIGVILLKFPVRFADAFTRWGQRMDTGDLSEYGLPVPEEGVFTRVARAGGEPTIVDKEVIEAIKARRFEVVGAVNSLDDQLSTWRAARASGRTLSSARPDTGGSWRHWLATSASSTSEERPGWSAGSLRQTDCASSASCPARGAIGYMAKEAKLAAKAIARELRTAEPGAA